MRAISNLGDYARGLQIHKVGMGKPPNEEEEEKLEDLEILIEEMSLSDLSCAMNCVGNRKKIPQICQTRKLQSFDGVEVPATGHHSATVIFLHGLNDRGEGWVDPLLSLSLPHVKYILPTAPSRHLSLTKGMIKPVRSWADLRSTNLLSDQDINGYLVSASKLKYLIEEEILFGTPPDRIIVGGFSQGGAVVATALRRLELKQFGGAFLLSTWLPTTESETLDASKTKLVGEMMICMGKKDRKVPLDVSRRTAALLDSTSDSVKVHEYDNLGHNLNEELLRDLKRHINGIAPQVML